MMSKQHFVSNLCHCGGALLLVFLLSSTSVAEEAKKIQGPVVITSQKLAADNKTHSAVFEHSVVARTPDMTIWADLMNVTYDSVTGNITRIDAQGNVRVMKEKRVITAREATYFSGEEKVVFTGEPRAAEGENVITGKTMIYI
ncbi:MAG: LptA/OstA family protein, partial [Thermodesulfovibrionales bacterium]|nr:LptA/OstA family protein [Thermodesulfovibrionales bacterium]